MHHDNAERTPRYLYDLLVGIYSFALSFYDTITWCVFVADEGVVYPDLFKNPYLSRFILPTVVWTSCSHF